LKNSRAIWLLLLANSISGVAQGISMLAIPWYFTGIIKSEGLFGKIFFVVTAISLLWGVYAGTLIDRYNRKHLFLWMNSAGFTMLAGVTLWGFTHGQLGWLPVAMAFGTTVFIYNIHFPNLYAFAQEITPRADYGRVTSLLEIQGQLTFATAGAFAAILLKGVNHHINIFSFEMAVPFAFRAWKIYEIFAIDATTYLIAFAIIYRIKSLPLTNKVVDTSPLRERMKTGFSFLRKHQIIFLFGVSSLLVFLTIIVCGLYVNPMYVSNYLHQNGDVYAFSDMAFSLGALLAGIVTNRLFSNKSSVRGVIILSVLAGIMYSVMAGNKVLLIFFVAQFIIGICNAAVRIQRVTYLFHHIPNRIIGRTNSIFFMLNVLMRLCLIGLFGLPFFHNGENIVYAMPVMAAICLLGAILLMVNYSKLMKAPVAE